MKSALCDKLGIEFPLFAFSHCRDVIAAVTNAGGMGVLGAVGHTPETLEIELAWIDEQVQGKPYGIDLLIPNKMDSKDDHRAKPKPRPAYNIDLIRLLAMAMDHEMVLAFYAALLERFGGAGKVKNLFALAEDERADRFHLVSLMVTVVFDANMSYAS